MYQYTQLYKFLKNPTAPNKFWDCICGWILGSKQLLRGCLEHHGLSFHSYPICPNPYPFIMLHGGEPCWIPRNLTSAELAGERTFGLQHVRQIEILQRRVGPQPGAGPGTKRAKKTGGSSYLYNYLVTIVRSHLYIYILCIHIYMYICYIYMLYI